MRGKNNFLAKKSFSTNYLAQFALIFVVAITILSCVSIVCGIFNKYSQISADNTALATKPSISYVTDSGGSSGTLSTITKISTASDLIKLATRVNAGNNYSGITVTVTQRIDLKGISFTPIGKSMEYYFSGTFDGGGYLIDNLSVSGTSGAIGLFGYTYNATISNVVVRGSVKGTGSCEYVGGIAGLASGGTFNNCVNIATVENASTNTTMLETGGIVGYAASTNFNLCRNYGTIKCSSNTDATFYSAGICSGLGATVTKCYNGGSISAGNSSKGSSVACGICFYGTIKNCYNYGSISAYAPVTTDTYYFLLTYDFYKKDGVFMKYPAGADSTPKELPNPYSSSISIRYGKKSWGSYKCGVHGLEDNADLTLVDDDKFQRKIIKSKSAFACGICYMGEISNCYNYASLTSTTFSTEWRFSLRLNASYGYLTNSQPKVFEFFFNESYTFPICVTSTSATNVYHSKTTTTKYYYYKVNSGSAVYFSTASEYSEEYSFKVKMNNKGTKTETHYFKVDKSSNSDNVRLYVRNSDSTGLVPNIFEELADLKAVFNCNSYISFEGNMSVLGTQITEGAFTSLNLGSTIWNKGNSSINSGRPYIKELYW